MRVSRQDGLPEPAEVGDDRWVSLGERHGRLGPRVTRTTGRPADDESGGWTTVSVDVATWTVEQSRARRCKRWSLYDERVIDLTVAEMDLPVADAVLARVRDAVDRQAFGYPLPDTHSELPAAVATWLATSGLPVEARDVKLLPDVIRGVIIALSHLGSRRTPVAILTPTYSRFFDAAEAAGRSVIEVPLAPSTAGYELDLDAVERALRLGAGDVLLCNPSNPTGHVFTDVELRRLSVLVERYSARVVSDEIHAPLVHDAPFTHYAAVSTAAAGHSVTLTSASKAWNIPGLRCAFAVLTCPDDHARWADLPRATKGGISPLGIEASVAALEEGAEWLTAARTWLRGNRDLFVEALSVRGHGDVVRPPEATYLAWLDLTSVPVASVDRRLLDEHGVATTAGAEHGRAGQGFVRVNLATPRPVLTDAVDRIATFLDERRS